jgi:hypothetical protein
MTILIALVILYVGFMLVGACYSVVIIMLMVITCLADLFDRFVEHYAIHVDALEVIENDRLVQWGTIKRPITWGSCLRETVRYFRIRLPLSLVWMKSDFGRYVGWHERQIVWTSSCGWFVWYERASWV